MLDFLTPCLEDITTYYQTVFDGLEGFIPLRGIPEKKNTAENAPPQKPCNHWVDNNAAALTNIVNFAERAHKLECGFYAIPGTVKNFGEAKAQDVHQSQVLLVDIDTGPIGKKSAYLFDHIGLASLVVLSGGITEDGEFKQHQYWKLAAPVSGHDLQRLIQLRHILATKIGGDVHFKSAHQPIRFAGSIHHKSEPKRVSIREICDITYTLDELEAKVHAMPPFETTDQRYNKQGGKYKSATKMTKSPITVGISSTPFMTMKKASDVISSDTATADTQVLTNVPTIPCSNTLIEQETQLISVKDVMTTVVHEGGVDEWTRFEGISRVIGFWVRRCHEGGICHEKAWAEIQAYNEACVRPSWSEDRLKIETQRLWEKHVEKYGPSKAIVDPKSTEIVLSQAEIFDWELNTYSGDAPERAFLIQDVFPLECASLLVAMGDTGKGLLLLDLALKVASGTAQKTAIGPHVSTHGSVAIFSAEDDKKEIHRRLNSIAPVK